MKMSMGTPVLSAEDCDMVRTVLTQLHPSIAELFKAARIDPRGIDSFAAKVQDFDDFCRPFLAKLEPLKAEKPPSELFVQGQQVTLDQSRKKKQKKNRKMARGKKTTARKKWRGERRQRERDGVLPSSGSSAPKF